MTFQQIQWTIARAAADAAVASFDAHGHAVPAETAWEFLHQVASDDEGVYEYMAALPAVMPRQFAVNYATVCEARDAITTKARISLACEVAHWAGDVADLSFQMGRLDTLGLHIFLQAVEDLERATPEANCWDWEAR